jgi:nucleoside-diphosphate kinase
MVFQQCLVLIKPDGLVKSLTGNIISILSETKGKIIGSKVVKVSRELAEAHYSELMQRLVDKHGEKKGSNIFEEILNYVQGKYHTDRVMALVYEGENIISKIRELAGSTNPEEASPVSIRGKYGRINSKTQVLENVMHVSDSEENAKKEIQLWFEPGELTNIIYPVKEEKVSMDKKVWKN